MAVRDTGSCHAPSPTRLCARSADEGFAAAGGGEAVGHDEAADFAAGGGQVAVGAEAGAGEFHRGEDAVGSVAGAGELVFDDFDVHVVLPATPLFVVDPQVNAAGSELKGRSALIS